MFGNFEPTLRYRANGRHLEACGPLVWDANQGVTPADRVTVAVTITQVVSGNQVIGHKQSDYEWDSSEIEWMLHVSPDNGAKFGDGPAQADGTFTVTDPAGNPQATWQWSQSVQLRAR
jgi:hypothetical protein